MEWIDVSQDREKWPGLVDAENNLGIPLSARNFFNSWGPVSFSWRVLNGEGRADLPSFKRYNYNYPIRWAVSETG